MSGMSSPPVYNGRYELSHQIARGGTAQVYLARDLLLDRPVALKVLFPELSTDHSFVERFRREAQAAANLSHPNIVPVFDWGESDRTYYIVMEYVDGEPLSSVIKSQGPLDPAQAAAVAGDIAKALSYAHRHGVVHRDVKPGNVLITIDGEVKVTDFGIARAIGTEENITQTGLVMGTATYFSPEQAQGLGVDGRSDVYSLGVVLFESVTGRPPFTGETPVSIAYQHVREIAPTPRSINPDVPAPLEAVILKAMAKQPSDRYATAQDFQADLQRFVQGGMPLAAIPERVAPPEPETAALAGGPATMVMAPTRPTPRPPVQPPAAIAPAATTALAASTVATRATPPPVPPDTGATTLAQGKAVSGEPPLPKTRTPQWLLAGTAVLLVIVLLALAGGRKLGYFGAAPWFGAPNVIDMQLATAEFQLSSHGLHYTIQHIYEQKTPDQVTGQNPTGSSLVQEGATIQLTVSRGPKSVAVTSVVGSTQAAATTALHNQGFKVTVTPNTAPPGAKVTTVGDVYAQVPPAATPYPQGSTVTIDVVVAPTTAPIPPVAGDQVFQATTILTNAHFPISGQTMQASSIYTAGEVIGTTPPQGTVEKLGTPVALIVSSGPPPVPVVVPDVSGETQTLATNKLAGLGFNVSSLTTTVCAASQNNLVQFTNPSANSSQPKGATITIYVGDYQPSSSQCSHPPTSVTGGTGNTGGSGNTGNTGLLGGI